MKDRVDLGIRLWRERRRKRNGSFIPSPDPKVVPTNREALGLGPSQALAGAGGL